MSVSFSCHCPERRKSPKKRKWRVIQRNCRCSAFDGYRQKYSDYSSVVCLACGAEGRTKARFVSALPDYDEQEYMKARAERGGVFGNPPAPEKPADKTDRLAGQAASLLNAGAPKREIGKALNDFLDAVEDEDGDSAPSRKGVGPRERNRQGILERKTT